MTHTGARCLIVNSMKLHEWCTVCINPYTAPEAGICLVGRVEGGAKVKTSIVVKVEGRLVTTASGSVYELLDPDPKWLDFLREHNIDLPTEKEPIRVKK